MGSPTVKVPVIVLPDIAFTFLETLSSIGAPVSGSMVLITGAGSADELVVKSTISNV